MPQLTQEKIGRGFGKNAGEWTGRVEISKEQIPGIDADVRRTVYLTQRGLVQHLSLLQADGEAEVLGCIREAVDDVL